SLLTTHGAPTFSTATYVRAGRRCPVLPRRPASGDSVGAGRAEGAAPAVRVGRERGTGALGGPPRERASRSATRSSVTCPGCRSHSILEHGHRLPTAVGEGQPAAGA